MTRRLFEKLRCWIRGHAWCEFPNFLPGLFYCSRCGRLQVKVASEFDRSRKRNQEWFDRLKEYEHRGKR